MIVRKKNIFYGFDRTFYAVHVVAHVLIVVAHVKVGNVVS
jgi:hypothetical protein